MTINIFVLKDLNGKIVVVRFFFCWVYLLLLCNEDHKKGTYIMKNIDIQCQKYNFKVVLVTYNKI